MNGTLLLIITLSGGGHWWSESSATIRIEPVVDVIDARIARYQWVLSIEDITLATGSLPSADDAPATTITIDIPRVRAATPMGFALRAYDADGRLIAQSRHTVHVYPIEEKHAIVPLIGAAKLLVWEAAADSTLSDYLREAGLEFIVVHDATAASRHSADVLIVGPNAVSSSAPGQDRLAAITASGTRTLVLHQSGGDSLAGFGLIARRVPSDSLAYDERSSAAQIIRLYHPAPNVSTAANQALLLRSDDADDSRVSTTPYVWIAADLRESDPATPHPATTPHPLLVPALAEPGTADALLLQSQIGNGRIILCQQPLGDPATDARAGLFLVRAIDELIAPVPLRPLQHTPYRKTSATTQAGAP